MRKTLAAVALTAATALCAAAPAMAQTTEVVTEADVTRQAENTPPTDNWVLYTRVGTPSTAGAFVDGPAGAPLGTGSLQLTTTTDSEKVFLFNYDHAGTALEDVDDIAYSTYRTAGSLQQVAALNMLGRRKPFDATPFFWSQHYDVTLQYVGHAEQWDRIEVDGSMASRDCTVRYVKGGRTLAVVTIGRDLESLRLERELEREIAAA